MTAVRDQLFPQKPPGSRFRFSRTGVQPSPGSSTIELPSAFAESGAYSPDRELPGSPRQCSLPLACRHPPEGHQIGARKRRTPGNTILSQPYCRRVSTNRPTRKSSQLAASLEGGPGPTPAGKTLPHSYPETRFRRERARGYYQLLIVVDVFVVQIYNFLQYYYYYLVRALGSNGRIIPPPFYCSVVLRYACAPAVIYYI